MVIAGIAFDLPIGEASVRWQRVSGPRIRTTYGFLRMDSSPSAPGNGGTEGVVKIPELMGVCAVVAVAGDSREKGIVHTHLPQVRWVDSTNSVHY